ncbi:MAG: trypsin-like peptidase domain-containing protein [Acidobacteriota bacterium]|nr:trypsin-like peptidase domain-containing protein [Acidobacteriota bacterium]
MITSALFFGAVAQPIMAEIHGLQEQIFARSEQAIWTTIPIDCWSDFNNPGIPRTEAVVGTGFLINEQGYFVTAGHVASIDHVGSEEHPIPCKIKAVLRQRDGSGFSEQFEIIELDRDHDLALCRILGFKTEDEKAAKKKKLPIPETSFHPFSSVAVETYAPRMGELLLMSGFPLGSYTPVLQLGLLSATENIFPGLPRTPKDGGELLQIAINGNHGDSGAPIVDLTSGHVIGVILQVVPAPLAVGGALRFDVGDYQNSGIMLAAPASWVNALLTKHGLSSADVQPGRLVMW